MSSAIIKALSVIQEQAARIEELEREVSYLLTRKKNNVALIEELEAEVDKAWGIIHTKSAENERLKREVDEREKLIVDNALLKEQVERLRAVYKAAILFRRFNGTLDTDDELDKALAAVQEDSDERPRT